MDVYGLIGNPVGHSLSPRMQQAGFDALDIDASYVTFEPARDAGAAAVRAADTLGIDGLNVTIPFKEDVLSAVDPDEKARRVGAVNTIDFTDQPPTGYNTDVTGAIRALRYHDLRMEGTTAVVIGAGGAARAIAFGLVEAGAEVHVANRTVERAESLAADIGSVTPHDLDRLPELVRRSEIVINATSVGMEADESVVPSGALQSSHVVMDAVYRPLETRLLKEATAAGAQTVDGAWMLLFQGVEAFERWTDRDAPVERMNEALRDAL